ncbi:MAG: hypothetical protein ACH350_00745 [Parachlamydiaceae bacterium]
MIRSCFHFLGGIHLAITLIAIAAISVIGGTFIESKTDSHQLAAHWTYEHPLFFVLLSLFFVNILFSALRRWPFKRKHFPFLITHLGLLMIIGGTMVKNRFGLQGQLSVWEGGGNQHLLLPNSHALLIEKKGEDRHRKHLIAFQSLRPSLSSPFYLPDLKCKLIGYSPHVKEQLQTWIKDSTAYIAGFPPIAVENWKESEPFPEASTYSSPLSNHFQQWLIVAIRTPNIKKAIEQAYGQTLKLELKGKGEKGQRLSLSLEEALLHPFSFEGGNLAITLDLPIFEADGLPTLNLEWVDRDHRKKEKWKIALKGQNSLVLQPISDRSIEPFFTVDLKRAHPYICLVTDEGKETFFTLFDTHGRLYHENFNSSELSSLIAYDNGFRGYGVHTQMPIASFGCSREDKEKAEAYQLSKQLKDALLENPPLSPPLQFLKEACEKAGVDFCSTFVQFLHDWNAHPEFLYQPTQSIPNQIKQVLNQFSWENVPEHDRQASEWTIKLMEQLEQSWREGEDLLHVLERHRWPLTEEIKQGKNTQASSFLNLIAMQAHALSRYFPPPIVSQSPSDLEKGTLLSAYFRNYGIDYRSLFPYRTNEKETFDDLEAYWKSLNHTAKFEKMMTFETPLSYRIMPMEAPLRPEDQRPGIVLQLEEGEKKETIALIYDPSTRGLKWPIFNGRYLIRFQPNLVELPYRIRLRQARQIFYPQSQQVYSYESDVLILEKGKEPIEHTLSMNQVYETWEGYRFYLAGIGTSVDGTLKRIQLAVNYDPTKYLLTYPGAFLVFLGTILLFWAKKLL